LFIDIPRAAFELAASMTAYPLRARISPIQAAKNLAADSKAVQSILEFTSSPLMNRANIQKHFELEKGTIKEKGFFEKLTYLMAGAPERVLLKPIWYGRFQIEFFNRTGKQFDITKASDPDYLKENRDEIMDAAAAADGEYQKIVGSVTGIGARRRARVLPFHRKGIDVKTNMGTLFTYMAGYQSRDFQQVTDAFVSAWESIKDSSIGDKEKMKQVAWAAAIPVGSLLGALTYNYLNQIRYVMERVMFPSDDEEEEEAKKELEMLATKKGVLSEVSAGIASLAATRYNGMGRQLLKAMGTIWYNMTDDKEEKAEIRKTIRNFTFQNPYDIDRYGSDKANMYETAGEAFAAASVIVNNFSKATRSYKDLDPIFEKIEKGEKLKDMETETLLMAKFSIAMFNATAQFAGASIPSRSINRFIDNYAKEYTPDTETSIKESRKEKAATVQEIKDSEVERLKTELKGEYVDPSNISKMNVVDAREKLSGTMKKDDVPSKKELRMELAEMYNTKIFSEKEPKLAAIFVTDDGKGNSFGDDYLIMASKYKDSFLKNNDPLKIKEGDEKKIMTAMQYLYIVKQRKYIQKVNEQFQNIPEKP
jgi:hypothetical protein